MQANRHPSIGFLGTYAPTVCGIASFTGSLLGAIAADPARRGRLGAVSVSSRRTVGHQSPVVFNHRIGDPTSRRKAVRILNGFDTVSVQHEFGIYGPEDGIEVLDVLSGLTVPTAVTLHTVLTQPSTRQKTIIEEMGRLVDRIVVMSGTAAERLTSHYEVDPCLVTIIPHGADSQFAGPSLASGPRPLVLTWGLIGPGKGLELAIEAFADLADLHPQPRYLIAGATHPEVRRSSGEAYRQSLVRLASRLGIRELVEFDDSFLEREALAALVRSADLVVLPYESVEQVTSGVLVEAIAASKPVIATPFPHAVEVLSGGAGVLVPHGNPEVLGASLRRLLTKRDAMAAMTKEAAKLAGDWYWPTVGRLFTEMMSQLVGERTSGRQRQRALMRPTSLPIRITRHPVAGPSS